MGSCGDCEIIYLPAHIVADSNVNPFKSLSFLFTTSIDYTVRLATVYYSGVCPICDLWLTPAWSNRAREIKESRRFVCFTFENVSAREATQPEDFIDRPTLL